MRLDVTAVRLRNQRLVPPAFHDPVDIVRWLGAVQSQDFPSAKWGLGLRGTGFTDADVELAFTKGDILRTHVLRPTWHFVTASDIRWMLKLTAHRVQAICASYYRNVGIDATLLAKSARVFERALGGGQALTRSELGMALGRAGLRVTLRQMGFFMLNAELEGLVCSGPRRGKQITYALLDERAPKGQVLSSDEALAELTRRYFTSHGPATVKDCSWWSGLTMREITRGIEILGPALVSREIEGLTCWFVEAKPARRPATPSAHLLPNYDEFLIAYQDRQFCKRASGPHMNELGRDMFGHHLIVDGRLAGSWKRSERSGSVNIAIATYGRMSRAESAAIRSAAERLGAFVGLPVVTTIATAPHRG